MADERVRRIQEAVAKAQALRDLQTRQSQTAQQAKEATEKAEREAIRTKNIERLEGTGVVGLFRGLRNAGVVRCSDYPIDEYRLNKGWFGGKLIRVSNFDPAQIEFSSDGSSVEIRFNRRSNGAEFTENGRVFDIYDSIYAGFGNDGRLSINGRCLEGEETIGGMVEKEILKNKGLL